LHIELDLAGDVFHFEKIPSSHPSGDLFDHA